LCKIADELERFALGPDQPGRRPEELIAPLRAFGGDVVLVDGPDMAIGCRQVEVYRCQNKIDRRSSNGADLGQNCSEIV